MIFKHLPRVTSCVRVGGDKADWVAASAVSYLLGYFTQFRRHADAVIHSPDPLGEVTVSWVLESGCGFTRDELDNALTVAISIVRERDNRPGYYRIDGVPIRRDLLQKVIVTRSALRQVAKNIPVGQRVSEPGCLMLAFPPHAIHIRLVPHRTFEISWTPRSAKARSTFTAARIEAARLWNDLVSWHAEARQQHATNPALVFPTEEDWRQRCKRQYPNLHSQSVQAIIREFMEAVKGCAEARKSGDKEARFPWKQRRYRDVPYSNQGARLRNGYLILPHGKVGHLGVKLPKGADLPPGRLMEASLSFGVVRLVFSDDPPPPARGSDEAKAARLAKLVSGKQPPPSPTVGIDLGVNTLLAATDGERAVLVSGRGVKASIQWRNKRLASLAQAQAPKTRGSRRHKRLQRRKFHVLGKANRRIKDALHKATRHVANAFPGAHAVAGKPFNGAARKLHRTQAQQVSQSCTRKAIQMLGYKLGSCRDVVEAYSSQTCPGCGCRQKCRRTYRCSECGWKAPRDVVGAMNILQIGQRGSMEPKANRTVPEVVWKRPSKYPGGSQVVPAEPRQVARRA